MREFRTSKQRQSSVEKSVFSEGDYHIVSIEDCDIFVTPFTSYYNSLLIHKCGDTKGVYNYTAHMHPYVANPDDADAIKYLKVRRRCMLCEKPIPDSVQTLWVLQNADVLDYDGDAGFK